MNANVHFFQILWGSDPVVKATLVILIGLSVVCWAIILYKYKELNRLKISSSRFLELFLQAKRLEEIAGKHTRFENPLSNIFRATAGDLFRKSREPRPPFQPDGIRRKVARATQVEVERIERYLPFLATTGSSAPFIGLFGTVWGILAAFWQIGRAGSTSLAVVGPYIAEALIATAFGLAAAIPAVIFYNYFVTRIRSFVQDIEGFGEELVYAIERDLRG